MKFVVFELTFEDQRKTIFSVDNKVDWSWGRGDFLNRILKELWEGGVGGAGGSFAKGYMDEDISWVLGLDASL